MQRKLIVDRAVKTISTIVDMSKLPTSTYFLKVTKKRQELKTFRIIKN